MAQVSGKDRACIRALIHEKLKRVAKTVPKAGNP